MARVTQDSLQGALLRTEKRLVKDMRGETGAVVRAMFADAEGVHKAIGRLAGQLQNVEDALSEKIDALERSIDIQQAAEALAAAGDPEDIEITRPEPQPLPRPDLFKAERLVGTWDAPIMIRGAFQRGVDSERPVDFIYDHPEDGVVQRRILPDAVNDGQKGAYVSGWDCDRENFRAFRLDRVTRARVA